MQAPPLSEDGSFKPFSLFGSGGILSMYSHGYANAVLAKSDTPLRSLAAGVLAHAIVLSFVAVDAALNCGHLLARAAVDAIAAIEQSVAGLGGCK
jgi:hypothetical protein